MANKMATWLKVVVAVVAIAVVAVLVVGSQGEWFQGKSVKGINERAIENLLTLQKKKPCNPGLPVAIENHLKKVDPKSVGAMKLKQVKLLTVEGSKLGCDVSLNKEANDITVGIGFADFSKVANTYEVTKSMLTTKEDLEILATKTAISKEAIAALESEIIAKEKVAIVYDVEEGKVAKSLDTIKLASFDSENEKIASEVSFIDAEGVVRKAVTTYEGRLTTSKLKEAASADIEIMILAAEKAMASSLNNLEVISSKQATGEDIFFTVRALQ